MFQVWRRASEEREYTTKECRLCHDFHVGPCTMVNRLRKNLKNEQEEHEDDEIHSYEIDANLLENIFNDNQNELNRNPDGPNRPAAAQILPNVAQPMTGAK